MLGGVSAETILRGVFRVFAGFMLLQVAVIGAFVTVGPWWALRGGLAGAAVVVGALGLLFDWRALDLLLEWMGPRPRRVVIQVSVAAHLAALTAAGLVLMRPVDPAWRLLEGTASWSDPRLALGSDGRLVALTGRPRGARRLGDAGWEELGGPGDFAWEFHAGAGGVFWSAPRSASQIDVWDPGDSVWGSIARGGHELGSLAVGTGELLAAVDGSAFRYDIARASWSRIEIEGRIHSVAVAADGVALALGSRWWERTGGAWREVDAPEGGGFAEAFVGGGGWRFALIGAVWQGSLYVAPPGQAFAAAEVPVADPRVLVAHPREGARVVMSSWGQGVWVSEDGAGAWRSLGLDQIQVRSVAVDWGRGSVCAASSNLLLHGGVFCRDIPGHPSVSPEEVREL